MKPIKSARLIMARMSQRATIWAARKLAGASTSIFHAARRGRRSTHNWNPAIGLSADAETLPDLDFLRARSRHAISNDPMARSVVSNATTQVVGLGHQVIPTPDAKHLGLTDKEVVEWTERAARVWQAWGTSSDCDVTRDQTIGELEGTAYFSAQSSGDCLAMLRFIERPGRDLATAVQLIEADRVSNPERAQDNDRIAGGVEVDRNGAVVAYHISDRSPRRAGRMAMRWSRQRAFRTDGRRRILHIHPARQRPDMTRFMPRLAPILEALHQRSRYTEAEAMAALMNACFAIGMKSEMAEGLGASLESATGAGGSGSAGGSDDIRVTEPGMIFDLAPNEEIQSFTPGRPSSAFEPFITALANEIGAGTDVPPELILQRFNASYSASRAALEIAATGFRVERTTFVNQFTRPVYEDVITEAVARGLIEAEGFFDDWLTRRAWLRASFIGPARISLDPSREARADETNLKLGITSRQRLTAERFGGDWHQVLEQRIREERLLEQIGVNEQPGTSSSPVLVEEDTP